MGVISHLYGALQGETDAAAQHVHQLISDSLPKVINRCKSLGGCAGEHLLSSVSSACTSNSLSPILRSLSPTFGVFSLQKHTLCDVC